MKPVRESVPLNGDISRTKIFYRCKPPASLRVKAITSC